MLVLLLSQKASPFGCNQDLCHVTPGVLMRSKHGDVPELILFFSCMGEEEAEEAPRALWVNRRGVALRLRRAVYVRISPTRARVHACVCGKGIHQRCTLGMPLLIKAAKLVVVEALPQIKHGNSFN